MRVAHDTYVLVGCTVCLIALPVGLVTVLLKFALSPLALPVAARAEREREQNLLAGILLSVFGCVIGAAVVYVLLAASLIRNLRMRRALAKSAAPAAMSPGLIPSVALSELMGMVFGMAAYPILVFGSDFKSDRAALIVTMIVVGAFLYPLCSLAAYNRVNARRVPVCAARTVYVALFPLMLFVCVFQPFVLLFVGNNGAEGSPFVQLGLGALATIAESVASWKCARRGGARSTAHFATEI